MRSAILSFICAIVILVATLTVLPYESELNHLGPDTLQYLEYSELIFSNHFFGPTAVVDLPKSVVVRTPGFPALLAIGRSIFPDDLRHSLLFIHTAIGLISSIFACIVFRRYLPAWGSAAALAILFFHFRQWFNSLSTEWTAFALSLAFLGSALSYFENPSPRKLAMWVAVAALLPIVRPNFALAFIPPLVSVFVRPPGRRRACMSAIAVGLSPLLALFVLNYFRFDVFSLTPYGGRNLFIAGILSGPSEVRPDDSPSFATFTERVNQAKHNYSPAERSLVEGAPGFERYFELYSRDFYMVEELAKQLSLTHIELNRYSGLYAIRAIGIHFPKYLSLQLCWYYWLFERLMVFIPAIAVVVIWALNRRYYPLALSFLSLFALHIIQMTTVISTQPPLERYLITTHYALVYATLLVVWRYCVAIIRPKDGDKECLRNDIKAPVS